MLAFFTCTLKSIVVIDYYLIFSFHCLRHLRKLVISINISASYSFFTAITTNRCASWGAKLKAKNLDKFGFVVINISQSQSEFLSAFIMTNVFLCFGERYGHDQIHSQTCNIFLVRAGYFTKQNFRVRFLKNWYSRRKSLRVLEILHRKKYNLYNIEVQYWSRYK